MPTLRLRLVGVSYAIEGIARAGLDGDALHQAIAADHGEAVAPLGLPVDSVLVDRRAESWEGLMAWLAGWVRAQGYGTATWSGQTAGPAARSVATLHFHA